MTFALTILGCGAALPANGLHPTAQVLTVGQRVFLIDCGEGTQWRFDALGIRRSKLTHCFISHFHGDHVFGLLGLITSYALMGRTEPLHIFSPSGLKEMIAPLLWKEKQDEDSTYKIYFHEHATDVCEVIFEDEIVEVRSIPLLHTRPTTGYLFKEKQRPRNLRTDVLEKLNIPVSLLKGIKNGDDYTTPTGIVVPNDELTFPPNKCRSYAFCSDTAHHEAIVPIIEGVDLLYHEASFAESEVAIAAQRGHSTARQAADIASKASVKHLLLGHFSGRYPDLSLLEDEARTVFANTTLAEEGQTYSIG